VSVLTSDICSVIVSVEPMEPVNSSARPLDPVIANPSEPLRDLPNPLVWEPAKESDPVNDLTKPLLSDPARENEPVSVLESATCSTTFAEVVSVPDSVL